MPRILVTGGYGFIGTHFLIRLLEDTDFVIYNIDCESYAANKDNIKAYLKDNKQYRRRLKLLKKDISNKKQLDALFAKIKPQFVVNIAAESHVDNSITGPAPFINANIVGTFNLLECSRKYDVSKYVQVSTDEVYGDRPEGSFVETDRLTPSNPYSSSKASAEMFVVGYHRTYGTDYLITRSSNNYGPRQYQEKLIPKILECIKTNKKIPLHGDGSYIRDWIYVKDNANAIYTLIENKCKNTVYNIGANNHMSNLEVTLDILKSFDKGEEGIQFVENRWGQDLRYSLDTSKIIKYTKWSPNYSKGIFKWWK